MDDETGPVEEKRDEATKLELKDYIALTIALLETTLLPFFLVGATLILLYATFVIIVTVGVIWVAALWEPVIVLIALTLRFLRWRHLARVRASFK